MRAIKGSLLNQSFFHSFFTQKVVGLRKGFSLNWLCVLNGIEQIMSTDHDGQQRVKILELFDLMT